MSEPLSFAVKSVVGTGDPFDMLTIIPLVHQWGAARACALFMEPDEPETCEEPVRRIVILREPLVLDGKDQGDTFSLCERHFVALSPEPVR